MGQLNGNLKNCYSWNIIDF